MADLTSRLVEQVLQARAEHTPVHIIGGQTKAHLGRCPAPGSKPPMLLDMTEHTGVISYSPTELVIRARAGTKISDLNKVLSEQHQRLPFEPPTYNDQATIGGTVAASQSGPARPWYGAVKDSLLGLGLVNGYGEAMQFGGQVMKNVAGFDVTRLQAGAMGSLGVITEVSIKLLPQFNASHTLVFELEPQAALQRMQTWASQSLPISGVCYWQSQLYVRLQGGTSGVAEAAQQLSGQTLDAEVAQDFWQQVREHQLLVPQDDQALWRWSGPASAPLEALPATQLINWAGSERWALTADNQPPTTDLGPGLCQYRGGDRQAEVNPVLNAHDQALQRRIKQAFDPDGLFNAGRLYAWL